MKLTLALSLSLAAALPVQAAELPSRQTAKVAPAAKTCRINGEAGVMLPGSDACLRVSGSLSAQTTFGGAGSARPSGAP